MTSDAKFVLGFSNCSKLGRSEYESIIKKSMIDIIPTAKVIHSHLTHFLRTDFSIGFNFKAYDSTKITDTTPKYLETL